MDHRGHGLALTHPVFQHPKTPTFEWEEAERPKRYEGFTSPLYPQGVPETYRIAKFETDKPGVSNPTIVSHEGFFTDVPGFENLAEGFSAKALGSLSIARQGRYLYWGYTIDPKRMTPGAADTFVNALYYMHLHRDSLTVPYVCDTRANFEVYTWLSRDTYLRGVEEHLPGSLVPELRESYTPSFEGADAFVATYLDYLYAGKPGMPSPEKYGCLFDADRDAMALGTANNDPASLARWVALADSGDGEANEQARRCLSRYVHPDIAPKDGAWTPWLKEYQDRVSFIDSTGFWWQLNPLYLERASRTIE
ncbi:MAG: hypothetical protein ACI80K_000557 [Paracoccaceae bacterium]|jgi:hypothetical protein